MVGYKTAQAGFTPSEAAAREETITEVKNADYLASERSKAADVSNSRR